MTLEYERYRSFPLRLPPSIWGQVRLLAGRDGISLNQFISQAIEEKMERLKSIPNLDEEDATVDLRTGSDG